LTRYAQEFNRRYKHHGELLHNRYKSVLCEQDPYLLELVRYIHLNPIRAGIVDDVMLLRDYPWSGHSALMGRVELEWQDAAYVLGFFSEKQKEARAGYAAFVAKGIDDGRRPDLTGGLDRFVGGWKALRELRREGLRIKGDERILGGGEFVLDVPKAADEDVEPRTRAHRKGISVWALSARTAQHYGIDTDDLRSASKSRAVVRAHSAVCYLAIPRLGATAVGLSRELNIDPSGVSKSVVRGRRAVREDSLEEILN